MIHHPAATRPVEKARILIVDDRLADTKLLKQYLEHTNEYVVRTENDATAAISAAEEFQPDLILLDVMMPVISGGDLAAILKDHPDLHSVPIVFLTAAVTKGEVDACSGEIGGYPFLAKPVVLTDVAACVKHQLGR